MTLYRQLLLSTLLILLFLCAGLWLSELKRTRDFLSGQMEVHAQDTASSLGLSLSTVADDRDVPVMETMINALFDRGYYHSIELRDFEGEILFERHSSLSFEHVPGWFVHLVPLPLPQATSLVMHGWKNFGSILVESHPGYAYKTLWQTAWNTAMWFSITWVTFALLGGLALRALLKPLYKIEEQALAICNSDFQVQEQLPRTRELLRVVTAMNQMTNRIRVMFNEQTSIANKLREYTYQDTLTALGNRRYLEEQIKAKLEGKEITNSGSFLLFQIQQLEEINQKNGYGEGDRIIKESAGIIHKGCHDLPEAIFSRLDGGDFALFLPNTDKSTASRIADTILENIQQKALSESGGTPEYTVMAGGVFFEQDTNFSQLLMTADTALSTARYNRSNKIEILSLFDKEESIYAGKAKWKELLEEIISKRSVIFYSQPTVTHPNLNTIVHQEILTRVLDTSDRHLSMGLFIPTAERIGRMPALDKMIIECLLEHFLSQQTHHRIAINLSPLSLMDEGFVTWLQQKLVQCARRGLLLNFEFPEFRINRYINLITDFSKVIKQQGHQIGIDNFGQGLIPFGYLKSLLPDYVKIDKAVSNELQDEQSDRYFFINTLCNVAHSLDIKIIAQGVENESQWQVLSKMHIDAIQGYYIQKPEPITLNYDK
ncbi:MAG: EAL domain-containing protein [Desulforhopalus sp.]